MGKKRGYSDKLVRKKIIKVHKHKRKDVLNNMEDKRNYYKLVLKITYHPNFSNLKDTMSFLQLSYLHQTRNTKRYFIRFELLVSEKQNV